MPTGMKQFLPKSTPTSMVNETGRDYTDELERTGRRPEPEDAEKMLLSEIRLRIIQRNNTADKNDRFPIPSRLYTSSIAQLMNTIDTVRVVGLVDGAYGKDYNLLALYQEEGRYKGLYTTDEDTINNRILRYSRNISMREVADVREQLRAIAPHVKRCSDPDLVAVGNGIFDYKNKKLLPFSPDFVFLSKLSTDYNPNAQNVKIVMPDGVEWDCEWQLDSLADDPEMREFIRQCIGAMVRPNVPWDKAVLAYSTEGSNGKGTLAAIMRAITGPDFYASIPIAAFGKDFMLEPLVSRQAIIVDENDVGAYIDSSSNFKAAITGDILHVNRKYKQPVNVQFRGFVYECINELPRMQDRSQSMLRRLIIAPFEKSFEGQERKYIKEDYIERQDVREYYLRMALESDFYELDEPKACIAAKDIFKTYNDPVRDFFESVLDPNAVWQKVPLGFAYELFKSWFTLEHPSGKVMSSAKFRIELAGIAEKSGRWSCPDPQKVVHIADDEMAGTEPLIIEYGLDKYKSKTYRGADVDKVCNFTRPKTVRGCLVRTGARPTQAEQEAGND